MKGFRDFVLRGNVIDLAVAVVIGTAFTAIVTALVANIFDPLIGAIFNADDLKSSLVVAIPLTAGTAKLHFGAVMAAAINFVIIAAVVYFVFVLPINSLLKRAFERQKAEVTATPANTPPTETELLIQIRDLLAAAPSAEGDHALRRPPA